MNEILISEVGEPNEDLVDFYFFGSMTNAYPLEDLSKYIKEDVQEEIIPKKDIQEEIENITIIKDMKEKVQKEEVIEEKVVKEEKNIFQIIIDFFKSLFEP